VELRVVKLAIWVGGDKDTFDRFKQVLDAIGDQARYVGPDWLGHCRQTCA
jgi:3-hydroxyisobutyrate dehydrogenase-like beta-hydroxyacid dehydrogenase